MEINAIRIQQLMLYNAINYLIKSKTHFINYSHQMLEDYQQGKKLKCG